MLVNKQFYFGQRKITYFIFNTSVKYIILCLYKVRNCTFHNVYSDFCTHREHNITYKYNTLWTTMSIDQIRFWFTV